MPLRPLPAAAALVGSPDTSPQAGFWNRLPEQMPTHFGFNGTADGYSGRPFAIIGLPLFLLAIQLLCAFALRAERKIFSEEVTSVWGRSRSNPEASKATNGMSV